MALTELGKVSASWIFIKYSLKVLKFCSVWDFKLAKPITLNDHTIILNINVWLYNKFLPISLLTHFTSKCLFVHLTSNWQVIFGSNTIVAMSGYLENWWFFSKLTYATLKNFPCLNSWINLIKGAKIIQRKILGQKIK